jgi:predicted transcriptional regulator
MASNGNDFGAFLGTLNKESYSATPTQNQHSHNTVLGYLFTRDHPTPVSELVTQTPMSFGALASALDTLKNARLVEVTAQGNNEIVELTDIGRQVAKINFGS